MNLLTIQILSYMLRDITKGHYASNIAKNLNLNQKTVSNHLHALKNNGFLKTSVEGKNRLFHIIKDKYMILQIETAKTNHFLKNNMKIKGIIKKADFKHPTLIFGSYAKQKQKKTSDLDILTTGNYNKNRIRELEKFYGTEINIKNIKKEELEKIKDDPLLNEIKKDHIIILGFEVFAKIFF